jgi:hypothetical protein
MKHLLALPACVGLMSILLPATEVSAQTYLNGPQRSMNPYRTTHNAAVNTSGVAQVYQPQQHRAFQYEAEPVMHPAEMPVKTYEPTSFEMPDPVMQPPLSRGNESGQSNVSSSTRAGLLGQSYLDAQFMLLSGPDDDFVDTDPVKGGRSSLNLPIPWPGDASSLFHQDMFLELQYLHIGGSAPMSEVDLELTTGTIGTTLFADTTDWFRPFLQLGWTYNRSLASITGMIINTHQREDDHDLLIRGGAEFDLSHNAALRFAAGNDQYATAELIVWPSPRTFFRLGGVMEFDVDIYGGLAGVGFTY